jgi:hypothetical protein
MRPDLNTLEKIDLYTSGQMNGKDASKFEDQLKNDPLLQSQLDNQLLIIQAAKRKILSKQINTAAKGGKFGLKYKIIFGLITLLFIGLFFSSKLFLSEDDILQIDKKVNTTNPSKNMEVVNNKKVTIQIDSTSNNSVIPEKTYPKKKYLEPKKETNSDLNETKSNDEFYDFNGLKCWVKPNIQTFEIDANKTETIEGENGTLIIIPKNSFLDTNNKIVQGKVNFELIEAYDLADMLLYNLTTTSNGDALETGGMFYTNATQNDRQLSIDQNKPMIIQVPCVEEKPNMLAFESEIDSVGEINWKNPKPLEKFLTKIDLNLVDFLPEGFEDEVYASTPLLGYKKGSSQAAYNIYYLFGYEKGTKSINEKKRRRYGRESKRTNIGMGIGRSNRFNEFDNEMFYSLPKDSVDCGVHPLTIKIIKSNPNFKHSFIATKEFEERLQVMHKSQDGEKYLQVYLNNLDKNLYEADSIVEASIKTNTNLKTESVLNETKQKFKEFYNQKKTTVKNGDEYATSLSEYYNNKRDLYNKNSENIKNLASQQIAKEKNKLLKTKKPIQSSNVSRVNNYTVAWAAFGWANIDAYLHMLAKAGSQDVEINCATSKDKPNLKIYQFLGAISTLTPIIVNQFKGIVKVPKEGTPESYKMMNVYTIALSKSNDRWFLGTEKYNPYKSDIVDVELNEISFNDLKTKINSFKGGNALTNDINKQIDLLNKLAQNKQKEISQTNALNILGDLCFSCLNGKYYGDIQNYLPISNTENRKVKFASGEKGLKQHLYKNFNLKECERPIKRDIVTIQFDVTITGELDNFKIIKSVNECIDNDLITVIKEANYWYPAIENGLNVESTVTIDVPIKKRWLFKMVVRNKINVSPELENNF